MSGTSLNILEDMYIWVLVLTLIGIFVFVWLFSLVITLRKRCMYQDRNKDKLFLKNAVQRLNTWTVAATFWMIIEYLCVIIPFVANVIVIYYCYNLKENSTIVMLLSIVSLSFVVFGYAINPVRHKQSYRKAYYVLDEAINTYITESDIDGDNERQNKVNDAIKEGEGFINNSYDS